jgi:hypothetical protein
MRFPHGLHGFSSTFWVPVSLAFLSPQYRYLLFGVFSPTIVATLPRMQKCPTELSATIEIIYLLSNII